jgi:hypothetical protein
MNIRCEASRYFRNKKRKYRRFRISEPETMSNNNKETGEFYRGINEEKKGYGHIPALIKMGRAISMYISIKKGNKWKNCFPKLLKVHKVNGVYTFEPLVPEPYPFEVKSQIWEDEM